MSTQNLILLPDPPKSEDQPMPDQRFKYHRHAHATSDGGQTPKLSLEIVCAELFAALRKDHTTRDAAAKILIAINEKHKPARCPTCGLKPDKTPDLGILPPEEDDSDT